LLQQRAWYAPPAIPSPGAACDAVAAIETEASQRRQVPFPPNQMMLEKGAVLCRVSDSLFRFGHVEWLAKRKKMQELTMLLDHVIAREFPHLQVEPEQSSSCRAQANKYVSMFRHVATGSARLVAEWLRVGYVHGNMNSDNTLLGGRTIDFGPFGFMEKFEPEYQPFTSDRSKNFGFCNQMNAMKLNCNVLGNTVFRPLIQHLFELNEKQHKNNASHDDEFTNVDKIKLQSQIDSIADAEFTSAFKVRWTEVRRAKLGFKLWDRENGDEELWEELETLLEK
jgi:uncharacterized protein YdiU (UPF0061 family)